MQKIICNYDGCEKEVCAEDMIFTPPTKRFCKEHSGQINALIENRDIPEMLSFYVKSLGGAKKATQDHR